MKLVILTLFFLLSHFISAQIVNVESLRKVSDTSKWSGYTSLSVNISKDKNKILNLNNRIHIQYAYNKNLWLFVNDIHFKEVNNSKLVSKGTQHLRYNYTLKTKIAWEVFTQSQYDEISEIDFRGLLGTGPRLNYAKNDIFKYHLGFLSMYEYEKVKNELEKTIKHDIRNSSYFSFSLFPNNNISIVSTTYFQPLYKEFSDYRISTDTTIALNIFKKLAFKMHFTYLFDSKPALGVPKEQFKLNNGLTYFLN